MSGATSIISYIGILAILFITMRLWLVDAAIGYDCDTKLQYNIVPLEDVNHCDLAPDGVTISPENIALLEINEYKEAIILQCNIEIHQVINKCVLKSSTSLIVNSTSEYIYPISRKACEIALDHGTMIIGKTTIHGLTTDSTTTHSVVLAGSVDSVGDNTGCTGEKYSDPYGTWNDVVVMGTAKITLQKHLVKVDVDSDSFVLPSGYQCKFSKGECIDSDGGYTFRDTLPLRFCSDRTFNLLYNGTATKLKSDDERVFSVMVNDTRFSVITIGNETLCGATFFKTDFPKLFIVESKDLKHLEKFKIIGNHTNNSDIFQYENDKIIYAEKFTRYPVKYLYTNVMEHKCKRKKMSLKTALATAPTNPDEFAFQIMGGPGYTAIIAKDKFYIVQCVPVEVKLQRQDKCYNRLPILKGNQTLFLTPWTHIITHNATELPCNSSLLQNHEMESTAYKVLPKPAGILEPKTLELTNLEPKGLEFQSFVPNRLKPSSTLTWEYQNLDGLATRGIHMEEDSSTEWDRMQHPEQFNPTPSEFDLYPDADEATSCVVYLNRGHKNHTSFVGCLLKEFYKSRNIFTTIFSCL